MFELGNIFLMAINMAQIFFQLSIITMLFKSKVPWWITFVSSAVISVLYFDNPFIMYGVFFATTFVFYSLIAGMRIKQVILAISIHLFLSLYIANIFVVVFRVFMPGINDNYGRIAVIMVYIAIFILIKCAKLTIINLTRNNIIFALSLISMLVALGTAFGEHFLFNAEIVTGTVIWNVVGSIVIQTTVIYIVFVFNKLASELENAELQKQYSETLKKSLDELDGYKHGYRNSVNTLYGYRLAEDSNGLFAHIDTLVNELNVESNVFEINHSIKDNMPYIYGIILSKVTFAAQNEIEFSIDVTAKIFELKTLPAVQLSRIIGNLLDNAMEHAKISNKKYVSMEISNHIKEKIRFVIKNSVNQKVDTSKIFKKGLSFKKNHTGFGLYEVKTIVDNRRDEGLYVEFNIDCTDTTFTAELLV